jgi:hypothetical protein
VVDHRAIAGMRPVEDLRVATITIPWTGPVPAAPTTNLLERLFVEERRRLKIIPNAFGERAVLKLMFGALIRAAERWRRV